MKISILDGHAVNPGDISWEGFKAFGSVKVFDNTPQDKVIEHIGDSEVVLTNKTPVTEAVLSACKSVKYVGVLATGYNVVDLEACNRRKIPVTNVPDYSSSSVAQGVFAHILEFTNNTGLHSQSVFSGEWIDSKDFCYWKKPLIELEGKKLGVYGFGNIGRRVCVIALAFGMDVLCFSRTREKITEYINSLPETQKQRVQSVDSDTIFKECDVISFHVPLTKETEHIINRKTLSLVKPSALIVNTARGGLADEGAVKEALVSGRLGGYCCDVVEVEPMLKDNPLLEAPNCIITPHLVWASKEARLRLLKIAENNIRSFLAGKVENQVNSF